MTDQPLKDINAYFSQKYQVFFGFSSENKEKKTLSFSNLVSRAWLTILLQSSQVFQ